MPKAIGSNSVDAHTLSTLIAAFKRGRGAYSACEKFATVEAEREFAQETYGWAMQRLEIWQRPAESREEAMIALKLARQEIEQSSDSALVRPMLAAALEYLEAEPTPQVAPNVGLIRITDQLAVSLAALGLLSSAVDGMGSGEEFNIIQYGITKIQAEVEHAKEICESARAARI